MARTKKSVKDTHEGKSKAPKAAEEGPAKRKLSKKTVHVNNMAKLVRQAQKEGPGGCYTKARTRRMILYALQNIKESEFDHDVQRVPAESVAILRAAAGAILQRIGSATIQQMRHWHPGRKSVRGRDLRATMLTQDLLQGRVSRIIHPQEAHSAATQ